MPSTRGANEGEDLAEGQIQEEDQSQQEGLGDTNDQVNTGVGDGGSSDSEEDDDGDTIPSNVSGGSVRPDIPLLSGLGGGRAGGRFTLPPRLGTTSGTKKKKSRGSKPSSVYASLFTEPTPLDPASIKSSSVLIPKNRRGNKAGSYHDARIYNTVMDQATTPLEGDDRLGLEAHYFLGQADVEKGNATKNEFIQVHLLSNMTKVKEVYKHFEKYDMLDAFEVPVEVVDSEANHPMKMFGLERKNLLLYSTDLVWEVVASWQWAINSSGSPELKDDSLWAYTYLQGSVTSELAEKLDEQYRKLDNYLQGGVVYAWLLCRHLFGLSHNKTESLKGFIKLFSKKGSSICQGQNIHYCKKMLLVAVEQLANSREGLVFETLIDVLAGFAKSSANSEFTDLAEGYLKDARREEIEDPYGSNIDIQAEIKDKLDIYDRKYDALATARQWDAPVKHKAHQVQGMDDYECFNCGKKGHKADACKLPRDKEAFARRLKAWREKMKQSGDGRRGQRDRQGKQHERAKMGQPGDDKTAKSQVQYIGGKPHSWCTPCNGYTTSHSTKYHEPWSANKSSFKLSNHSPRHPLVQAQGQAAQGNIVPSPSNGNGDSISKSELLKMCSGMEDTISSTESIALLESVKNFAKSSGK